jgi:acetyl-CoA carboxylase biotin carboxyl carrier protein
LSEKTGKSPKKSSRKASAEHPAAAGDGGPMDVSLLQQLVKLMAANDLNTVDLRDGTRRVVLKRGAVAAAPGFAPMAYAPQPQAAPAPHSPAAAPPAVVDENAGLVPIKSPMVGTFYSKPNPESKSFVIVGSQVDDESDVCIIEAMKTFNTIKAECRGVIAKILVTDGQAVDVGKPLFLVKPN